MAYTNIYLVTRLCNQAGISRVVLLLVSLGSLCKCNLLAAWPTKVRQSKTASRTGLVFLRAVSQDVSVFFHVVFLAGYPGFLTWCSSVLKGMLQCISTYQIFSYIMFVHDPWSEKYIRMVVMHSPFQELI